MHYPSILSIVALVIASVAYLFSVQGKQNQRLPYFQGRNNTVLFLANAEHGLSNVLAATSFALLQNHPDIDVHYASWPKARERIDKASFFAKQSNPEAKSITFHELSSLSYEGAIAKHGLDLEDVMNEPGWRGASRFATNIQLFICPWEPDDHYQVYTEIGRLIDDINPAVIVLDTLFRPAIDIVRDKNWQHIFITPNTHVDNFLTFQPHGSMFWKYPAAMSGFEFPIPWSKIPGNIYINAMFIYGIMSGSSIRTKQASLRKYGLKEPIDFLHLHRSDVPWITMHTEGASIPVDVVPDNVTSAGPIIIRVASAEQQDPAFVKWMERGPTVLINLGSSVHYNTQRAVAFADAISKILQETNVQIIWKFQQGTPGSTAHLKAIKPYLGDRLLVLDWLKVDPYALLETGLITVSVHHGGSGCYHESILSGVPQVILPVWADLYSFASLAESLRLGIWGCRKTSPQWNADCIADSILQAIRDEGMADHAKTLGETIRSRGHGRDIAAREVAKYASILH